MAMYLLGRSASSETILEISRAASEMFAREYAKAMRRMPVHDLCPAVVAIWREEGQWCVKCVDKVSYVSAIWCEDNAVPEDSESVVLRNKSPLEQYLRGVAEDYAWGWYERERRERVKPFCSNSEER